MRKTIKITDLDEVNNLCRIATEIYGLPDDAIKGSSRKQTITIPRMAVSNIALLERGVHYNTIATVLNRDRCSIYHYEKQHEVLYSTWTKYRDAFMGIKETFMEDKPISTQVFESRKALKTFLMHNRVNFFTRQVEVILRVTTGYVSCIVPCSLDTLSNNVAYTRGCLNNYNYKLELELQ